MFDKKLFETIIRPDQKNLKKYLYERLLALNYQPISKQGFIYAKGDTPVLLVAHMDTVHRQTVATICYSDNKEIAMSPEGIGGDDRCGVYMILRLLQKQRCSVLFTEDEEKGCVGARAFTQAGICPELDFIIEFDRKGSKDAVFYDCDNPAFTAFITGFDFVEEDGIFSDISDVAPHLKTAAVNLSCGYYNPHQTHEYINIPQMEHNIEEAAKIIAANGTHYEYIGGARSWNRANLWGDYLDDDTRNYKSGSWFNSGVPTVYQGGKSWQGKGKSEPRWLMPLEDYEAVYIVNDANMNGYEEEYGADVGIDYKGDVYLLFNDDTALVLRRNATVYDYETGEKITYNARKIRKFMLEK